MPSKAGQFLNENTGGHTALRTAVLTQCAQSLGWKTSVYGVQPVIFVNCKKENQEIEFTFDNSHNVQIEAKGYESNQQQANKDANDILTLMMQTGAVVFESGGTDNVLDSVVLK